MFCSYWLIHLIEDGGGYSPERDQRRDVLSRLAEDAFTGLNTRYYETSEDDADLAFDLLEADYRTAQWI